MSNDDYDDCYRFRSRIARGIDRILALPDPESWEPIDAAMRALEGLPVANAPAVACIACARTAVPGSDLCAPCQKIEAVASEDAIGPTRRIIRRV